jgi:hypothetical protein
MIYIFKGAQSICSLPGYICKGCGEVCSRLNCKPCQDVCVNCGSAVTHFFERPLSTFVIFAFLCVGASLYSSALALGDDAHACKFRGDVKPMPYVGAQVCVAVVFLFFAPYLQRAVWRAIMGSLQEDPDKKVDRVESKDADAPEKVRIRKETVQEAFRKVFLEDFFVLAIFLLLCANAVLSSYVQVAPDCQMPGKPYGTSLPKGMLASCAVYTLFYYCCTCCANKVEIERSEVPELGQPLRTSDNLGP